MLCECDRAAGSAKGSAGRARRRTGAAMPIDFLPSRESELVTWINTFKALIIATPTAYGLTAAQATAYGTLATNFINAYTLTSADATRSPSNIVAKDDAKVLVV